MRLAWVRPIAPDRQTLDRCVSQLCWTRAGYITAAVGGPVRVWQTEAPQVSGEPPIEPV